MITAQYQSPIGIITLVSDGNSLTELQFTKGQGLPENLDLPVFAETRRWLDLYFTGIIPDFTPPLNPKGTLFQLKVWRELLAIPYGQTTTYGAIAKRLNCRSAQAIGQAIHRNPIAIIIPCHRVIGSNGSLTGYAAGLEIKQELLTIENFKPCFTLEEIILIQTQTPSPHSPIESCQNESGGPAK